MTRRLAGLLVAVTVAAVACSSPTTSDGGGPPAATGRPTPRTDPGDDAQQFRDAATNARRADDLLGTDKCIQTGAAFSALIAEPTALAAGGTSPERIDQFKRDIESLRPQIPDPLRGDMDTLAAAYETAATELAGFGNLGTITDASDLRQKTQDAQDAIARLQDPKVKDAEQHLLAYFADCTTRLTR